VESKNVNSTIITNVRVTLYPSTEYERVIAVDAAVNLRAGRVFVDWVKSSKPLDSKNKLYDNLEVEAAKTQVAQYVLDYQGRLGVKDEVWSEVRES